MSQPEDDDDGPYWLDGLTPEEQLAEIDKRERYVREVWKHAPPALAKASVGQLSNNLARFDGLRKRIAEGKHPTRDDRTPEQRAEDDRYWAEVMEEIMNRPPPPAHRPYKPDGD